MLLLRKATFAVALLPVCIYPFHQIRPDIISAEPINQKGNAQILPKDCVLSDELMKDFWVMKLIDDSMAVKVAVRLGMKNGQKVEITNPRFNSKDRILSSGNFGLADTTLIQIVKE